MADAEQVRAQALEVAAGWSRPDAPQSWQLTAALFELIADHDELLGRLADLPSNRLPALLASAAICYLVGADGPASIGTGRLRLARYFPAAGEPQPPFDADFEPLARDYVSAHLDQIDAVCKEHRYQMNEVARCTQVAVGIVASVGSDEPIALIDLGTGAGLGLQLDRYRYLVDGQSYGPARAGLSLTSEVRGPLPLPGADLPPIAHRTGIEASPIDLANPAARAWLLACTPPEASALTRLRAAIEVTLANPPPVVEGDAVAALPRVLDGVPAGLPVVITDAYLSVFLAPEQRARLIEIMAEAGRRRRVTWLSLDPLVPLGPAGAYSVQDIPVPDCLVRDYQQLGVFAVLGVRIFDGTAGTGRLLARAHPSGHWVEWLDSAKGSPPVLGTRQA